MSSTLSSTASSLSSPPSPPSGTTPVTATVASLQPLCAHFDCIGVLRNAVPLLLSTLVSSLLFGVTLMIASHAYSRSNKANVQLAIVLVVVLQIVLSSVQVGKILQVFAANFGNLSGLVKHRPSNTLVPLLGEIVQSYTTLIMLFRGYQSLQATRWSIWVKRGAMGVLTLGWVADLVGGIAVCTQIKALRLSSSLLSGRPAGEALDRWVLLQLGAASVVVPALAVLFVRERFQKPSSRYRKRPRGLLQRSIQLVRDVVTTATVLASVQIAATVFWVLGSQYRRNTSSTWLNGFLATIPSIFSVTSIAVLSTPPPRPSPRLRSPRKSSKGRSSGTSHSTKPSAESEQYFDRPFLFYTTTADLSPSLAAFGDELRAPPAPPYSEPGRARARSTAPTFRPTHARSRSSPPTPPPPSPPPKASASFRQAFFPSASTGSKQLYAPQQPSPLVTSITTATEPLTSGELAVVVKPTCVVEAGEEEAEREEVLREKEYEKERSAYGLRGKEMKRQDTITRRLMEAGRMGVKEGREKNGEEREKERRRGVVLVGRGGGVGSDVKVEPSQHSSPSTSPSPQRCSTPSINHYDPTASNTTIASVQTSLPLFGAPPRPPSVDSNPTPVDPSFSPSFSPLVIGSHVHTKGEQQTRGQARSVKPFAPAKEVFGLAL